MSATERMNTTERRLLVLAALVTWTLLCLPPAVAQSNSLFGGKRRAAAQPVPTTQPATAAAAAGLGLRAAAQEVLRESKVNETLLYVSPLAVDVPEPEVIKIGDQVTVVVRVSKTASSDSKLESKKDWKNDWELKKWIRYSDLHGIVPALLEQGNPAVEFEYKDDYGGEGKYDRKDELTTRVQATVIDVKPNGNLVLEAKNDIAYGEEHYTMTLTGMCRARDVTPQNTILSSQIADLEVRVTDLGAVRDATRRGWLKRALDFLRPF